MEPDPAAPPPRPARPRPTALELGVLAVGLVLTNHYAWLLDDAFVFFRYVDNWVIHDWGLVYNRGEYVEGFTSPAWTLLLAALRATGLDYWPLIRGLGLASFGVFWWLAVDLNRTLATAPGDGPCPAAPIVNFPLLYLGLNYAVLCYFTSGVEAPLVQVAALGYAMHLIRPERLGSTVWVALSPLVRPELALALAGVVVFRAIHEKRLPWRLLAIASVAVGGWVVFRIVYYADLLPNTFYLKDATSWRQGFVYLHETLWTYGGYAVGAGFAALAFALRRRGVALRGPERLAMLGIAAAVALYLVRVGGDPRHYRYLAFSFCLATAALGGLAEQGLAVFAPAWTSRRIAVGALGAAFGLLVATRYPPQLGAHPIHGDVPHTMIGGINDAAYHRNHERLRISPWSLERIDPGERQRLPAHGPQLVTNGSWCEWIYRLADMRVIHNLGLTDAVLARVDTPITRPAHKDGLQPMAEDMEAVHRLYTAAPGMYRLAVERGTAADWMARNLDTLEVIEMKIYNRHRLIENVRLAFAFPPRIEP